MLDNEQYYKKWIEKKELYRKHGIEEGKNLIISKDGLNGTIDSSEINSLIDK